jgi:hypothetical protein
MLTTTSATRDAVLSTDLIARCGDLAATPDADDRFFSDDLPEFAIPGSSAIPITSLLRDTPRPTTTGKTYLVGQCLPA